MGAIGLFVCLYILNRMLIMALDFLLHTIPHGIGDPKLVKGT